MPYNFVMVISIHLCESKKNFKNEHKPNLLANISNLYLIFVYGFLPSGKSSSYFNNYLIIFYINLYLVYFSALIENQDGIHYKKLFYYWKERNLERILELIPKYLISIFFCFFLIIPICINY